MDLLFQFVDFAMREFVLHCCLHDLDEGAHVLVVALLWESTLENNWRNL